MPFHQYGKTTKFPRDEHVDIHVRLVDLDADAEVPFPHVEIREYIRDTEAYGHGLVLPVTAFKDLVAAGTFLGLMAKPSVGR